MSKSLEIIVPPVRLGTDDLCARIHKSRWWVYTNRKTEGLKAIKVGRELLFPIEAVEDWEKRNTE